MMKTQLILRPDEKIKTWLERKAKQKGTTVNAEAIHIIWTAMEAEQKQNSA